MTKTKLSISAAQRLVTVSLLTAGLLLAGSAAAWADRDGRHGRQEQRWDDRRDQRWDNRRDQRWDDRHEGRFERRGEHRPQQVKIIHQLPRGYRTQVINRVPYYVHEHRYYTRAHNGYILVQPPIGALVASLPFGYLQLNIGGTRYYRTDDVYYRPTRGGYTVVAAPIHVPYNTGRRY